MEKEAALPNDFPTEGVELRCFLEIRQVREAEVRSE